MGQYFKFKADFSLSVCENSKLKYIKYGQLFSYSSISYLSVCEHNLQKNVSFLMHLVDSAERLTLRFV